MTCIFQLFVYNFSKACLILRLTMIRVAHFPVFQFPVGKREIWMISRSGKTGKSGKIKVTTMAKIVAIFEPYFHP